MANPIIPPTSEQYNLIVKQIKKLASDENAPISPQEIDVLLELKIKELSKKIFLLQYKDSETLALLTGAICSSFYECYGQTSQDMKDSIIYNALYRVTNKKAKWLLGAIKRLNSVKSSLDEI